MAVFSVRGNNAAGKRRKASTPMQEQKDVRRRVLRLSNLDVVVNEQDNSLMAKSKPRRAKPKHNEIKEKTNQFGQPLAKAIKTTVYAWKCSECGAIMPLVEGQEPPVRCSNRQTCGRVFYNEP